ncbi:MAG: YihY family inner membrane protein, partial [Nitrospinae bacterium]|nr:YihY family inner membrane protein [Nitrospinota bacterium]
MIDSPLYRKIVEVLRTDLEEKSSLVRFFAWRAKTLYEIFDKFMRDDCPTYAASLAYTSLIALAPATAVTLSAISAFELSREAALNFIFTRLLPNEELSAVIEANVQTFAGNAVSVSAFGAFFLALFVIWGLNTVEWSFNMIWKVERSRPLMNKFISYWSAITFAPILVAVSLVASAKLRLVMESEAWEEYSYLQSWTLKMLPFLLVWTAFFLVYRLIPNTTVRSRPALIGAVVGGTLFELAKGAFNFYLINYGTYQAIYGAIAIIPIFLFWLYVTWLIVLLGAVVAYAIQYPAEVKLPQDDGFDRRSYRTYYGLRVALEAARAFAEGKGALDPARLETRLSITAEFYREIVWELHAAGYMETVEGGDRVLLARAPDQITVADIIVAFNAEALAAPRVKGDPIRDRLA